MHHTIIYTQYKHKQGNIKIVKIIKFYVSKSLNNFLIFSSLLTPITRFFSIVGSVEATLKMDRIGKLTLNLIKNRPK